MIPETQVLLVPALRILGRETSRSFRQLRFELEDKFGLSQDERSARTPSDNDYIMSDRLHRALALLIQDGVVIKFTRTDYQITDRGRQVLAGTGATTPSRLRDCS